MGLMRLMYGSCDKYPACCEDWNSNKWHMCSNVNMHWNFLVSETGTLSLEFVVTSNQNVIGSTPARKTPILFFPVSCLFTG